MEVFAVYLIFKAVLQGFPINSDELTSSFRNEVIDKVDETLVKLFRFNRSKNSPNSVITRCSIW